MNRNLLNKGMKESNTACKMRESSLLLFISLLFIFTILTLPAFAKNYEATIKITTTTGEGISIDLVEPDKNIYKSNSNIQFRTLVSYNRELELSCNLFIDSTLIETITITDGNEKQFTKTINLIEGNHEWYMACSDSDNNIKQSTTKYFSIDLSSPVIRLNNQNPEIALRDNIDLSFTPIDNMASKVNCIMQIDRDDTGKKYQTINTGTINNNRDYIKAITAIDHGNYSWFVECSDEAGNLGTSSVHRFYIDLKKPFNITPNKEMYSLGEGGVMIIDAPFESEVTLIITNPKSETQQKTYTNPYPIIDSINYNHHPGTYTIDGFLRYKGAIKEIKTTYEVDNNFVASIKSDGDIFKKDSRINFTAYSSGGIGEVKYEWEIKDSGIISTARSFERTFRDVGTYAVKLTVTDEKRNTATAISNIRIRENYITRIQLLDKISSNPLKNAKVYIEGEERSADNGGIVQYDLFAGTYILTAIAEGYYSYYNKSFEVIKNDSIVIHLEKTPELLNSSEKYTEIIDETIIELDEQPTEQINQTPKEQPIAPADVLPQDAAQDLDISMLITEISSAISNIGFMNAEEQSMASAISLLPQLEKADIEIKRIQRDLHNIMENRRQLDESELAKSRQDIKKRFEFIRDNTVVSLRIIDADDFMRYPSKEDVEDISKEYIKSKKITMDSKTQSHYISSNEELQSMITVLTKSKNLKISYASGEEQEVILVIKDITYSEDIKDSQFIVMVPKSIAATVDDMIVFTDHEIINPDPLIGFDIGSNRKIIYWIKSSHDLSKVKDIKFALVSTSPRLKSKAGGISVVGNAVFSSIDRIDNPILVLEIIAIMILLAVFLFYQFDLKEKIETVILFKDKNLEQIRKMVEDLEKCLANREIDNAEVIYEDIMKEYRDIPPKTKAKIHKKIMGLYNRLLLYSIDEKINTALAYIKNKDLEVAMTKYLEIQEIYKTLPAECKAEVAERCQIVYEKLAAGKSA
jgi:PKD repeat protein